MKHNEDIQKTQFWSHDGNVGAGTSVSPPPAPKPSPAPEAVPEPAPSGPIVSDDRDAEDAAEVK